MGFKKTKAKKKPIEILIKSRDFFQGSQAGDGIIEIYWGLGYAAIQNANIICSVICGRVLHTNRVLIKTGEECDSSYVYMFMTLKVVFDISGV